MRSYHCFLVGKVIPHSIFWCLRDPIALAFDLFMILFPVLVRLLFLILDLDLPVPAVGFGHELLVRAPIVFSE